MGTVIYVMYYHDDVALVTTNHEDVVECEYNNFRDKLEVWIDGKLFESRE